MKHDTLFKKYIKHLKYNTIIMKVSVRKEKKTMRKRKTKYLARKRK